MHYYIRCSRCEELVEVRSEYMVFCPRCEAKLDNSFAAWSRHNPGHTYTDYLSEVTVSDTTLEGVRQQRKIGRQIVRSRAMKRMSWALGIATVLAIIAGVTYWTIGRKEGSASIQALLDQPWRVGYYADLGATLKFPYPIETEVGFSVDSLQRQADAQAAADTTQQQVILSAVSRRWTQEGVLIVTASRIDYRPDFGVDRDQATRQILMGMLEQNDLQGFEYFKNDYSIPNVEARSLSGRYLSGPEAFEFRALMAQHGHAVWYFMVAYPSSAPEGLLVADRFFTGILIDRKIQ